MEAAHWKKHILPLLPPSIREILNKLNGPVAGELEEIRLRTGRPLLVHSGRGECFLGPAGVVDAAGACRVRHGEIQEVLMLMTEYSLYARDEELRRGYLALPGGHRAGFSGRTVLENNSVRLLRDISGINIRICREVKGAGDKLLTHLYCGREKRVRHTLLVSAPQAGKTTLLRDLARLLSDGDPVTGRPGFNVGIVDERSEIAGCYLGQPQLDIGQRSDVLDGCPKAEGMMMLVRSMSPQVVVTDELGRAEDVRAVEEVVNTGASILASAHGQSVSDLLKRPSLAWLIENRLFERVVLLSRARGPGTVEGVLSGEALYRAKEAGGKSHVC
jgi:stage III sporulation protein AA